jgi:hypothetical protein
LIITIFVGAKVVDIEYDPQPSHISPPFDGKAAVAAVNHAPSSVPLYPCGFTGVIICIVFSALRVTPSVKVTAPVRETVPEKVFVPVNILLLESILVEIEPVGAGTVMS